MPRGEKRVATTITIDPTHTIGAIHPWLFGSFVEHMRRCVYDGIYDPNSPVSNAEGFREDVMEAVRGLKPTHLRYPGGNFVSGYHWRDGVGLRDTRPLRHEHAWNATESNDIGTHEFISYCRQVNSTPHFCVNLGSGSPEEAGEWVEYCNGTSDTTLTRLRAANGSPAPFAIPLWGLGNEMYGPWQVGYKGPAAYAEVAREAALRIRRVDPTVRLIACGWEDRQSWNATVLATLAPHVDYLSLHCYIGDDDYLTAVAQPIVFEQLSRWHSAVSALVCREMGLTKRIPLAFDEWNVWFETQSSHDLYSLKDALAVAGCLNALIRCADVVTVANQSLLVNVSAPIYTSSGGVLRQTIYWPLQMYRRLAGYTALHAAVRCDGYRTRFAFRDWRVDEDVPYLDVTAALDPAGRTLVVAVVNRHPDAPLEAEWRLVGARAGAAGWAEQVGGPEVDTDARNTFEEPDRVGIARRAWVPDAVHPRYTFAPRALTMLTIPLD